MNSTKNMLFARNEIENKIGELQRALNLTEDEMLFVVEGALSTARHKALLREIYSRAEEEVKKANTKVAEPINKTNAIKEKEGESL